MNKKLATIEPDDAGKPNSGWQFIGSQEAVEALARRDELQAETIAAAMRALERIRDDTGKNRQVRRLKQQINRLKKGQRRNRKRRRGNSRIRGSRRGPRGPVQS